MKTVRPQSVILAAVLIAAVCAVLCASGAAAITLGEGKPASESYQPCDSQLVVYDTRPELGIGAVELNRQAMGVVSDIGVRLVRHIVRWDEVASQDSGVYDFAYIDKLDSLVEDCRKRGIYLVLAIRGIPANAVTGTHTEMYSRMASFAYDMTARYPSVVYWELPAAWAAGLAGQPSGRDLVPSGADPANAGEMLRAVYPAIKAANPGAWVACAVNANDAKFVRGLYEAEAARDFDILALSVSGAGSAQDIIDKGTAVRQIMADYDDQQRPMWVIDLEPDASGAASEKSQLDFYKECFRLNNSARLYQKVFIRELADSAEEGRVGIVGEDMTFKSTCQWLQEEQVNSAIFDDPGERKDVFVPGKDPIMPVGYDCAEVEGGIEIRGVRVDALVPTSIILIFVEEPAPPKPGEKPEPEKPTGTRPIPDPFDI